MHTTVKPEQVGLCARRLARIRPWLQAYIDAGKLPGGLVMIARRGQVAYLECAGYQDVEKQISLDADTLFRIYSMSKPITSVAAMMLYERGLFQLDEPLADYLPCFKNMQVYVSGQGESIITEPAAESVTIRQLLTHTSGLTYGFFNQTPVSQLYRARRTDFEKQDGPLAEIVRRLAGIPLICQPGSAWNYGVSTDVLGHFVEILSGQTLDRFFRQEIFDPLAMRDTGFAVAPARRARFAALYTRSEDPDKPMDLLENAGNSVYLDEVSTFSGGGGLVSTAADYFRFCEMLRRQGELDGIRLLGRKTVQYMTGNHLPGDLAAMGQPSFNETTFAGIGFGLGFSVMLDPAKAQIIGSPGEYAWGGAASTAFWIDPLEDMSVIFMTQLLPSSTYPLRRELRVLTYQALID